MHGRTLNMSYKIFISTFLLSAALGLGGCSSGVPFPELNKPKPRIAPAQELPSLIRKIPSYTRLSYSGLAYFRGKLFVTTNIGLIGFVDGKPSEVYKWKDRDDVLSGPWWDRANDSLWAMHDGLGKLVRFDGTAWHIHDLPEPEQGYTRGDMLSGFRGIGNQDGFWIEGGGHVWRWESSDSTWQALPRPADASMLRIIPLPGRLLAVTDTDPVVVQEFTEGWKKLYVANGMRFLIDEVVVAGEKGFVKTDRGEIFRITPSEAVQISQDRLCETIAVSTSGSLIASFGSEGIFEYSNGWSRKFAPTFSRSEPDHWAHLVESDGHFALSITGKPEGYGSSKTYPGQTTLWVSSGNELLPVSLGNQ